ncbi:hypothetical protein, partial [Enterococcus faecalis]|uniref:hypothetical protein n=1 Tax=Enterococcus faecalis TaxID=1351 RepID=UPI003D6A236F
SNKNEHGFWEWLQIDYFSRFPGATNDDVTKFLLRFTEASKNSNKEGSKIIEELFEEERKRTKGR